MIRPSVGLRVVADAAGACLVAALPSLALACGACDEDNIAATYDHAVVAKAARSRDLVVYCRVAGPVERQKLIGAVRAVPGVRKDSVRVSLAPAALSFAVDPALQTAATAVAASERGLAPSSRLQILKVVAPEVGPVAR